MEVIYSKNYNIYVGPESFETLSDITAKYETSQVVALVDENTERWCLPIVPGYEKWNKIIIPAGECHKNITTASAIWRRLLERNIHRNELIINLGGGVVTDIGGFCASVWKRGIDFINVPTSLLAMVDASYGGKTGIDFEEIKNQMGTFAMPRAVIIDPVFLKTLPERELVSGVAEMIKHSVIATDNAHFDQLDNLITITSENIIPCISESVKIKNRIVLADPFERNIRRILNFGHTFGHALEALSLQTAHPLLHGEAIALGMKAEIELAHQKGLLSRGKSNRYTLLINRFFERTPVPAIRPDDFIKIMKHDKKNTKSEITFALPTENDGCLPAVPATYQEIRSVLQNFCF